VKHLIALIIPALMLLPACEESGNQPSSDQVQAQQQEQLTAEGTRQTGMPAIKNFRERKMLKDILELRDQAGLVTYTYIVSEMTGRLRFFGETIGYGIPYATQYTNPQKIAGVIDRQGAGAFATLPQADPNGLFSPSAAEGTWVLMKDPHGDKVLPVYVEPRIVVSPFRLPESALVKD
jgi:hypothetical protein